jgi:hypothetical protein
MFTSLPPFCPVFTLGLVLFAIVWLGVFDYDDDA